MINASKFVAHYLDLIRQGYTESAFFALIESEPSVIPVLIEAFPKPVNSGIRAKIVQCIWQHRRPEDVSFLANLLYDPESAVWREALDGLVAIGGSDVVSALQEGRMRLSEEQPVRATTVEWVDEALEQIREVEAE